MNAYAVLGLEDGADKEEIRTAYRRLVKECHPDRHGDTQENRERFARLTEAYDAILNPRMNTEDEVDDSNITHMVATISLDEVYTGTIKIFDGRMVIIPPGCIAGSVYTASLGKNETVQTTIIVKDYPGYTTEGYDLRTEVETTRRSVRKQGYIILRNHP